MVSYFVPLLPTQMAFSVGRIAHYDANLEDFDQYCARVDLYFKANEITGDKLVPAFLTLVGPKVYTLAKNLLSPKDPATCKLNEIKEALKSHYKPKVILIYERYKFHSRAQKPNESVADFVAALKELAHTCQFGTTLNETLRDRFVTGLSNAKTQHSLLTEADLTFARAVEIATAREVAQKDVQAMGNNSNAVYKVKSHTQSNATNKSSTPIYQKSNAKSKGYSKNNSAFANSSPKASKASTPKNPCSGCGRNHWKSDCPFKEAVCYSCNRKGHLKSMCGNSKPNRPNAKHSGSVNFSNVGLNSTPSSPIARSDYDHVFHVSAKMPSKPIVTKVCLNDREVPMELDTGTAATIIPKDSYEKLWPDLSTRPSLHHSMVNLNVYGGSSLTVLGEITVNARLSNSSHSCKVGVVVVQEQGPCLLGRDLSRELKVITTDTLNFVASSAEKLKAEFPDLFSDGLGCYQGKLFSIVVDPSVPAKFCKARTVPYALRNKVDKEITRLQEEGIISPISSSPWAAPVVPVQKGDGTMRLCGDYKLTVNKAASMDTYPIPTIHDLFSNLAGGVIFSKLDMSQAYAQLCLDDVSKQYTVINTHRGLFQYNRLSFGISSAPGIFQRAMEELLHDIENVSVYLDDILVKGSTREEHDKTLRLVLSKLQSAGLKLKLDKCHIGVPSVTYLGYKLDKEGIHPTEEKVKAISEAPAPTNITQLRAYLGLLNFYRRFLPKAATLLEPLNRLLKANTPWSWGVEQDSAFKKSKEILLNSEALVHFDPKLPLVVVADSSSYGIGGVLCHLIDDVERPICFVSRTLTTTERNYSQLEKEALAMVFALGKFHYYLWGQPNFTVITDHKPLLGIFSPTKIIPPMASGRIQRWSLLLQSYNFTLRHRSGALLGTADALSRLPLPNSSNAVDNTPIPADWHMLVNFLDSSPITSEHIRKETSADPIMSKVFKFCELGWPNVPTGDPNLTSYVRRKNELSLQNGCILWGSRVVIPPKLRNKIMSELHSSHAGSSRMKELARSYVWWPNLDKDLEELCNSCPDCLSTRANPPKAELHPWEWPTHPWHRIHVDYAGPVSGRYFLIIVDAHSKWVDIYHTKGTTSSETINCLQHSFAQFGLPISIVSDNGPCFTSQEFQDFIQSRGLRHITTAVYKPSTNGLAERMVQTFKRCLKKSSTSSDIQLEIDRFVFNYRLTPHSTTGVSPAELMFGRRLRSRLDLLWPSESISAKVHERQQAQRRSHSKVPRKVQLPPDSTVMIRNYANRGPKWIPSVVSEQTGPLSYRCSLPSGVVKRHQDQIIPRNPSSLDGGSLELEPEEVSTPIIPHSPQPIANDADIPAVASGTTENQCKSPTKSMPLAQSPRRSVRAKKPVDRLNL